jgi:uncharacterized protein with HEPN domain
MSDKDWRLRLFHMRDQASKIIRYTTGMTFHELVEDEKTFDAVIRCFQVLGEAAKKVPPSFKLEHPSIPWKEITGLRDILVHDYDDIDAELVYQVLLEKLPRLENDLNNILESLKDYP